MTPTRKLRRLIGWAYPGLPDDMVEHYRVLLSPSWLGLLAMCPDEAFETSDGCHQLVVKLREALQ